MMSDYEKRSLELVDAGLRAGTIFQCCPAGTPGPTGFPGVGSAKVKRLATTVSYPEAQQV